MALDASFTVEGSSVIQAHQVAYGATVDLAALSLAYNTIEWSIVGSSKSGMTTPTITRSGTPTGSAASFTQVADPGDGLGRSWLIKCLQSDSQGQQAVAYRIVGTANSQGRVPFVLDEELARHETHGWLELMNELLNASGGGGVTDHGGLTGLGDDDHTIYELAARTLVSYSGAASTAVLADARKSITTSHGSANTFTIPANGSVPYATATLLGGVNIGAGTMTLTPDTGVTLNGNQYTVPQNAWWFAKKTNTNTWYVVVLPGVAGSSAGGGMGFPFTYSSTTTDSDPGAGTFRGNNATLGSSTQLFVDDLEYNGTTVSAWLATWDDAISSGKGTVRLQSKSDQTKWLEWPITAYTSATGYSKITVGTSRGPGGITTTAGDTQVIFDAGATGTVPDVSLATSYIKADGTRPLSANWALGNQALTGIKALTFNGEIDNGNSSTADTVDWSAGQAQKSTLTGNCTYTFSGPTAGTVYWLRVIQDGTGGRTVTWPGSVMWLAGQPPMLNSAASGSTLIRFWYDGTTYWGSVYGSLAPSPVDGGLLTNANATKNISDGSKFTLPAGTLASSAKILTIGTSGTPEDGEIIEVIVFAQGQDYILKDGGSIGDNFYTVTAGQKRVLHAQWNASATAWRPAGKIRLT